MPKKKDPKILHKRWESYTTKEMNDIKEEKCMDCDHFRDKERNNKDRKGHLSCLALCSCDYIGDTGNARICRPEICPYSRKGGGIQLNQTTHEKFVNYEGYCPTCKYRDEPDTCPKCDECLSNPTNYESMKPINYEKREDIHHEKN